MCWSHHKVILVCMGCVGTRTTPSAPTFIIHSSKLNSAHSRSMTPTWVMLNLMEKKGLKLEDLGEKSLLVVLKSRTHFLCYFYIPSCPPSLRSLVPNKRDSEKEQQYKGITQLQPNLKPTAVTAQVLLFMALHAHRES